MSPVAVGLDVGTTNTKAVVLDVTTNEMCAMASVPTPVRHDPSGPVRDPQALWCAVQTVLDEALWQSGAVEVVAVCTASVGEEVVLVDEAAQPVADVPVWYGQQGPSVAAAHRDDARLATIDPSFSLFKLAWLHTTRPDRVAAASTWTDVSGFVAATLLGTGLDGVVVDTSHASRTGLLAIADRSWDPTPLDALGFECALPKICESGTVIGTTRGARGRLPAGVPVVAGGHDHFCGAYGAGLTAGGTSYLSAGTSEAQLVLSDGVPDASVGVEVGCYVTPGLYYAHVPMPSGRLYQRWRDLLFGPGTDDSAVLRGVDPDAAPRFDVRVHRSTGAVDLNDVPLDVTRDELIAGLMRGIALAADDITDLLGEATRQEVTDVLVAGAAANSPVWRAFREATSTRHVSFVDAEEVTARGAAHLAAAAVDHR